MNPLEFVWSILRTITIADFIAIITPLGAIGGVVIYLIGRKKTNASIHAITSRTNKEVEQIEQEIESKYAIQVKSWFHDLEEIKEKHDIALLKKENEVLVLNKQHLAFTEQILEHRIILDRYNRASRRLLVNMDVPYWECDSSGKLTYVNGEWIKLFGISSQEAIEGKWLDVIIDEDREILKLEWNARVTDQSEELIEFNIINPITKEKSHIKSVYSIIFNSDESIFKIIGVTVKMC